jgi:Zn-dependent protease with chaperone function
MVQLPHEIGGHMKKRDALTLSVLIVITVMLFAWGVSLLIGAA